MENFDYLEALKKLEAIAAKVENPETGIEAIGDCIRESDDLIEKCRRYLRTVREETNRLDK